MYCSCLIGSQNIKRMNISFVFVQFIFSFLSSLVMLPYFHEQFSYSILSCALGCHSGDLYGIYKNFNTGATEVLDMTINAVIFDLDGVLIDSLPAHYKSYVQLYAQFFYQIPVQRVRQQGHNCGRGELNTARSQRARQEQQTDSRNNKKP